MFLKFLAFPLSADLLPQKGSGAIMGCHEICRDLEGIEGIRGNTGRCFESTLGFAVIGSCWWVYMMSIKNNHLDPKKVESVQFWVWNHCYLNNDYHDNRGSFKVWQLERSLGKWCQHKVWRFWRHPASFKHHGLLRVPYQGVSSDNQTVR